MTINYLQSFALSLFLCLLGSVSAQGIITYGEAINSSGDNYTYDVKYLNNNSTFEADYLNINVNVQGINSITGASNPNNAGWNSSVINQANVRFRGYVNGSNWNDSPGAENVIGTIQFSLSSSNCPAFQTNPGSFLYSFSPFQYRPVNGAYTECIAIGSVLLATSNDDLRTRTVTASSPGEIIDDVVGGVLDNEYRLGNVPPQSGVSIFVVPTPEFDKWTINLSTADVVATTNHIL